VLAAAMLVSAARCSSAGNETPAIPSIAPAAVPSASPVTMSTIVRARDGGTFTRGLLSTPEGKLPYRLYVPAEYDAAARYPLVIWLHGAGGSGDDNVAQIAGDQVAGTRLWTTAEWQKATPTFVLVPQTNSGWDLGDPPNAKDSLNLVLRILDLVMIDYPIDAHRVYLLGQSMGGGGAWQLLTRYPERFAGAVLVCPVIRELERAPKAAAVPLWMFMGSNDTLVTGARAASAALHQAGGHARYTEYPGAGHDIWTRVFKEPELPRWLFAQTR
jgi:predicted peptidase